MGFRKHFSTVVAALALTMMAQGALAEKVLKLGTVGRLGMPIGDAIDQALIPTLEKVSGGKLKIEPHYRGSLCGEQTCGEQANQGLLQLWTSSTANFGSFGTACLDARSGDELWRRRDLVVDHMVGPGSSPLLHAGKLVFHQDGGDLQYVIALDATTGGDRDHVEAVRMTGDDVEGLLADAPGAAEDREAFGRSRAQDASPSFWTCALVRPKRRSRR